MATLLVADLLQERQKELELSLLAGAKSAGCGYISAPNPANFNEKEGIGRVDYTISDRHRTFARYFIADYLSPVPANLSAVLFSRAECICSNSGRYRP